MLHRRSCINLVEVDHIHLIVLHHHVVEVNCIHLIVLHRWIDTCVAMVNHIHLIVLPRHVVEDNRIHLKVLHREIVSNAKMKYWISFYYCQSKTSYLGHSSLKTLLGKTSWEKSLSKGKKYIVYVDEYEKHHRGNRHPNSVGTLTTTDHSL